jgi:hypothetical protein
MNYLFKDVIDVEPPPPRTPLVVALYYSTASLQPHFILTSFHLSLCYQFLPRDELHIFLPLHYVLYHV